MDVNDECGDGFAGNLLCEPFLKLPSKRRYSDYYREIKQPIALDQIRSKLGREEYANLADLIADLGVMFENAKSYNRPDSKIYKYAVKLQKAMQAKVQELDAGDDEVRPLFSIALVIDCNRFKEYLFEPSFYWNQV